jgi:hypothetical protein
MDVLLIPSGSILAPNQLQREMEIGPRGLKRRLQENARYLASMIGTIGYV